LEPDETSNNQPPVPFGALPSKAQLRWHAREIYAFLHFTVNTFTDREWGYGDEDCSVFNPTAFDADQIVSSLKAGGMKAAILTCKHHDGFCLWPTKTTDHNVSHSSWKDGKGDVVREISTACKRHGLEFGIYVSPWDRNNPHYGSPEYVNVYRQQLHELLTEYGPICEVWHDGANGGDGYYGGARETRSIDRRVYYHWPETWAMIRKLQPNAVIFSDVGPDIRWVGNESGFANETCWATYDPVGEDGGAAAPGFIKSQFSGTGTQHGKHWLPAECDVSIRPGWFWHEKENSQVKSPVKLLELYYKSVGRGASFLLNVPPDRRGLINEADAASLAEFSKTMKSTFKTNVAKGAKLAASNVRGKHTEFGVDRLLDDRLDTYWATDNGVTTADVRVDNTKEMHFNVVKLRENIALGQRIDEFGLDTWVDGAWHEFAAGTSIGSCRLVRLPQPMKSCTIRLRIVKSSAPIALAEFGLYLEAV
jgi:alpha-L-fucosidase